MTQTEQLAEYLTGQPLTDTTDKTVFLSHRDALDIAEFLIDNHGVIVPPCKMGDKIYVIPSAANYELNKRFGQPHHNRVHEQIADEIRVSIRGYYIVTTVNDLFAGAQFEGDFAKTWFLSREKAEQALKEYEKE